MRPSNAVLSTTPSMRTSSTSRSFRSRRLLPAVTVWPTSRWAARGRLLRADHHQDRPERDQGEARGRGLHPRTAGRSAGPDLDQGAGARARGRAADALREAGGRLELGERSQRLDHLGERLAQLAARRARGEVGVELGAQDLVERALEVVGEKLLGPLAVHARHPLTTRAPSSSRRRPSRRFASSRRARLMRLFTVPRGILQLARDLLVRQSLQVAQDRAAGAGRAGSARSPRCTRRARSSRSSPAIGCSSRAGIVSSTTRVLASAAAAPACRGGSGRWRGCAPRP